MNDPFTPEFAEFAAGTMEEWKLPGMSIAVVDGDDVFSQSFGYATLPDITATPETLWYGGSTTKAFVTAALAHLIESKEYPALSDGWQTKVSRIIREDFVTQDDWATNNITLEDLASHRSGLSNNDAGIRLHEDGRKWTIRDIARNLRNFPLESQPRTNFSYNNEAYATLSLVIETVTGKWLRDVLRETIWEPLGMNSTYLDLQEAKDAPEHLSTGYYWDPAENCHKSIEQLPTDILSGAGAIISNVLDYTKWIKCLLQEDYGVVVLANHPSPVREIIVRQLVNDRLKVPLERRYDIAQDARDADRRRKQEADNAVSTLFPNAPSSPRQPSVDVEKLAGKYYHPGYGVFEFTAASTAGNLRIKDLVADRIDVLWRSRVVLCHV
ncbi:Beta-lactamase/transpeptidase-like [Fusarium oxysporum f. sp. vasinfectum]|nr:Beta-lactamase/transpeptidase-like [Fusarium oxysporum f. sp. vasinfectum]